MEQASKNQKQKDAFEILRDLTLAIDIGKDKAEDYQYHHTQVTVKQVLVYDPLMVSPREGTRQCSDIRISYRHKDSPGDEISVIFNVVDNVFKVVTPVYTCSGSFTTEINVEVNQLIELLNLRKAI